MKSVNVPPMSTPMRQRVPSRVIVSISVQPTLSACPALSSYRSRSGRLATGEKRIAHHGGDLASPLQEAGEDELALGTRDHRAREGDAQADLLARGGVPDRDRDAAHTAARLVLRLGVAGAPNLREAGQKIADVLGSGHR